MVYKCQTCDITQDVSPSVSYLEVLIRLDLLGCTKLKYYNILTSSLLNLSPSSGQTGSGELENYKNKPSESYES